MADAHQLGPLLAQACAGDQGALSGLLDKLRPYVRLLVGPRLGPVLGRKLDDSDLIQESLLRVFQRFGQFRGREVPQFLGWVGQITSHVVADWERHHGAQKRCIGRERAAVEVLTHCQAEGNAPEQLAARDEEAARLAAALERLPEVYREVIQARFFHQLPFAEISQHMGKSPGALRVVCLRAIERLRQEMEAPA
jgi:RNA polymerase sigma-70 factor (ECF subfamily)